MFSIPFALPLAFVVLVIALLLFAASRYRVAGANEVLVVAGATGGKIHDEQGRELPSSDAGVKVVVGGGTIIWPIRHKVGKLSLQTQQIDLLLRDAVTKQGIGVEVAGTATFKIARDPQSLRAAAERFLNAPADQMKLIVKNVLEGSLRSVVGTLSVEDLISDRQKLLQAVQEAAVADLRTTGIHIDAFTISSITDHQRYVEQLAAKNFALVERDARMAKATANQEASVREADAQKVILQAQQEVKLKSAEVKSVTDAANATAEQAGPRAEAEARQAVVSKQTELAAIEAQRTERELLSTVVRPAEAAREAAVARATGEKQATILQAEGEAKKIEAIGEAEGKANYARGKGEADAKSVLADALRKYGNAAIIQTILQSLPEIVKEAAAPIGAIDQLTIIDTGGANKVVESSVKTLAQSAAAVRALTGIDLTELLPQLVKRLQETPEGDSQGASLAAS